MSFYQKFGLAIMVWMSPLFGIALTDGLYFPLACTSLSMISAMLLWLFAQD